MSTEQALLALVACLAVGTLALVAWAQARLTGTVKLELEVGAGTLARALRERDQARALASQLRAQAENVTGGVTATSHVTQRFVTAALNPEAKVTVTSENGESVTVPQENDPAFLAELQERFNLQQKERLARRSQ